MATKNDATYKTPKLEVAQVATEGIIAVSLRFEEDLEWKPDPDPTPKPYDGDIWVNF
jgi:hypothetical protein